MNEQPSMPAAAIDDPICEARADLYTCTRPPGHEGDHAAHGYDDVIPVHTGPLCDECGLVTCVCPASVTGGSDAR